MKYLSVRQLLKIHETIIEDFGGETGVLLPETLKHCATLPGSCFFGIEQYDSVFKKAAALLVCISKQHPFVDGNKRTAFLAATGFLEMNGYIFTDSSKGIVSTSIEVAKCALEIDDIAPWLEGNSKAPLQPPGAGAR